uniref:lectin like domain-containing protein n=1 Tax=Eubacterium cellulosolvens TaxID=29322 RepID=UPI00047FBA85|nr:lectin like domain-containing protein [[Eubacterium] cellulosolvens]
MRKKLLALLLATSTISSTLLPAQCVFAGTTGGTDVAVEDSSAGNKPTPTPAPTRLFKDITLKEIAAEDYVDLTQIPYGDNEYGNVKRAEISNAPDWRTIKASSFSDAYPISHEDIPGQKNTNITDEIRNLNDAAQLNFFNKKYHLRYEFTHLQYASDLSPVATAYINSQQPTYSQDTGDCSINAATELANKTLIAEHIIPQKDIGKIRMSRAQISYNSLYVTKDPLDGFHGDYSSNENGQLSLENKKQIIKRLKEKTDANIVNWDYRRGTNQYFPIRSMYSGMGPVRENDEKKFNDEKAYELCNGEDNLSTEDVYNNNFARLTQMRTFQSTDLELIKQWIYLYGGVGFNLGYHDFLFNCCDYETNCVYSDYTGAKGEPVHALTIVGWDDTFPGTAFTDKDGNGIKNGAWLVKNSWNPLGRGQNTRNILDENGKRIIQDNYGHELSFEGKKAQYGETTPFTTCRYFWLSYYSPAISDLHGIAFENKDYFDNIYQYDGYQKNTALANSTKASNIFKIKNPDSKSISNKAQELKCVGFEITGKNTTWKTPVKYEVNIYRNISDNRNPESGTLVQESTTTGYCSSPGIYTEELKTPILLKQGEQFSVVVTLTEGAQENKARIAVEENDDPNDLPENHRNESFIQKSSKTGRSWTDISRIYPDREKKRPENVRIKAMTVNTDNSSTIDTTPVDPTPTVAPTSTPVADCAKLSLKAKVSEGHAGFECTIETSKDSPLTNQISYIKTTNPDNNSKKKNVITPFASLKRVNTKNGNTSVTLFYPIDPSDFEKTIQFEILDDKFEPVEMHLSDDSSNSGYMAYTTSMKEYLDKLKDAAISNNDTTTENFANALMIHMACSQNIYQTKAAKDINIDLSTLNDYGVANFTANRVKQGATDSTDQSINCVGISFNWKNTRDLSFIYYVTDPSSIKSIQIDGNDIAASSANSHQFEDINGQHCLIVSLSDIPIADYKKPHTITIENTYGNQVFTTASVYSYIYTTLKSKYTDQPTRNYAKSLALLKDTYDQLDKNDSRYKDFFIF